MEDRGRTLEFRRNARLEAVLAVLNGELEALGDAISLRYAQPHQPPILIVGCARSGTTLLLQSLAATGEFAYPTNLISRFYAAPWIGARVQQVLTDPACAYGDEFADLAALTRVDGFRSRLGKTRGLLGPNEFWYFWRRFFPSEDTARIDEATWNPDLGVRFAAELAAWEHVTSRPLVLKAGILAWNLPLLARLLPRAIFLHVQREPIANLQSLLLARRRYFDRDDLWYSFKPVEYPELSRLPVADQLAGQLACTQRAITEGLAALPAQRVLTVSYEEFCARPAGVHDDLGTRIRALGGRQLGRYTGPDRFDVSNDKRLDDATYRALLEAWQRSLAPVTR